jgi:LmbE family N-acetylglucosaminyl deacetylase
MNVLAISAHPDDETLGCGGTLLRHRAAGDRLFWLIATQPHEPQWTPPQIEAAARQVEQVAAAYGVERFFKLGLPSTRLDALPQADLIAGIARVIREVRPEVVYLVHAGDVHTDHHAVFTAVFSAAKTFATRQLGLRRVLSYETLSSTDAAPAQAQRAFVPNVYHDITPFLQRKVEIMSLFKTEVQPDPLPRGPSAIQALARFRGAAIGVEHAEAFMLLREVA